MYISLKWVQNIISLEDISLAVLCERLTLAGFEIEEIIEKQILDDLDYILDVSLTANRSDIFNIKGFTKELSSIFFKEKGLFYPKEKNLNSVNLSLLDKKSTTAKSHVWENFLQKKFFYKNKTNRLCGCSFDSCFSFLSIESNSLTVQASKPWLEKCLISSNVIPINNILDTINLVRLETGYPFFACDLNKLKAYLNTSTFFFSIELAKENQQIEIEPDRKIVLQPNNLLLYVNNKPISILGLLSIKEVEVDKTTTNILIYGGLFDPVQIRKSSQSLGIRTEESVSLEKNLNFNGFEQAFIRLSYLLNIQKITLKNSNSPDIHIIDPLNKRSFLNYIENKRPRLKITYKEIRELLGSSVILRNLDILNILKALHFQILIESEENCEFYIPFSRELDLERDVDIIEEIVRISGFTSFISLVPNYKNLGKISKLEKLKREIRKTLIELGLNEVLHYSISTLQSTNQLELKNPILPESTYFRSTLLDQLLQKAAVNKKQKNNIFEAFEIGRVYSVANHNIIESELLGGIFGGNLYTSDWNEQGKLLNWFEAKGIIEHLFEMLNISVAWKKPDGEIRNIFHPGRTAILQSENESIGFFGQIHPMTAKTNSLSDETFLFEFSLEVLEKLWRAKQIYTYKPYSLFPASLIDLACIKKDTISFKAVEETIREVGKPLLDSVTLFDYYSGAPIPTGYHSLGFKLKFRNFDRTLTNDEVEDIVKKITISLEKNFEIVIRT